MLLVKSYQLPSHSEDTPLSKTVPIPLDAFMTILTVVCCYYLRHPLPPPKDVLWACAEKFWWLAMGTSVALYGHRVSRVVIPVCSAGVVFPGDIYLAGTRLFSWPHPLVFLFRGTGWRPDSARNSDILMRSENCRSLRVALWKQML